MKNRNNKKKAKKRIVYVHRVSEATYMNFFEVVDAKKMFKDFENEYLEILPGLWEAKKVGKKK